MRPLAGAQQHPPPALAARQHSAGERRQEAGAEDRRLAAARRADDAEEAGADEPGDELGDEPLAAEEVLGVGRLEAREPLERADALGSDAGRGRRAGEGPRLLAHELQVDHLAGELGLDLAQVAPAGGGTRGDVGEQAARLVDRDRQRRPGELAAARDSAAPAPSPAPWRSRRRARPAAPAAPRSAPAARPRDARTRPRGPSRAGTAAARRGTRRARSRASRRPPARRPPRRRSARGRRSRSCPAGGRPSPTPASSRDPSRQAEVRQVDVVGAVGAGARVEQDVRGLHVPVDEPAGVGRIERARDLRDDADRIRRVEAACAAGAPCRSRPST